MYELQQYPDQTQQIDSSKFRSLFVLTNHPKRQFYFRRRGSWWSSSRGTIRVAVSLERLQANIIRAALPPNRAPVGVPLGAGVGAGGVARAAVQEAKGEEVLPPAELSCKVCVFVREGASPIVL